VLAIERGEGNPSLEIIEKLANALDISVASLFSDYKIDRKKGEAIPET
jgi:transcriptional regulator with XRE-family HTH domain